MYDTRTHKQMRRRQKRNKKKRAQAREFHDSFIQAPTIAYGDTYTLQSHFDFIYNRLLLCFSVFISTYFSVKQKRQAEKISHTLKM